MEGTQNIRTDRKTSGGEYIDPAKHRYRRKRIANWDRVSKQKEKPRRIAVFYHRLLQHYYKFLIPPGLRILELGCGHGDLLASLKPSLGVGVDFSGEMIRRASKKHPKLNFVHADAYEIAFKEKFDTIILSDLVNDLWEVQDIFERLHSAVHPGTRLVLNFYNNLWRIPLSVVKRLGLGFEVLEQNWLSPHDIFNLLKLSGFETAEGDVLMILDADMTVPPEDLTRFFEALVSGKGEFINGSRLVYPVEAQSMRFSNIVGNKFFSLAFSWLLGQPIKDTLCGTKVLWKRDCESIAKNRDYFGNFDPFGDFDLLFGAAKLNLKIVEVPIRYRSRAYGDTNINRWRHGWLLLKMVFFAARRMKFI